MCIYGIYLHICAFMCIYLHVYAHISPNPMLCVVQVYHAFGSKGATTRLVDLRNTYAPFIVLCLLGITQSYTQIYTGR